jgi:hypothetical protein
MVSSWDKKGRTLPREAHVFIQNLRGRDGAGCAYLEKVDRVMRREDPDCPDAAPVARHGSPEMRPSGGCGLEGTSFLCSRLLLMAMCHGDPDVGRQGLEAVQVETLGVSSSE